jgi:hypothetical protein
MSYLIKIYYIYLLRNKLIDIKYNFCKIKFNYKLLLIIKYII